MSLLSVKNLRIELKTRDGIAPVIKAPFAITEVSYNPTTFEVMLTFNSKPGAIYLLEHSDDLTRWEEISDDVTGTDEQTTISFLNPGPEVNEIRQYFRLRIP